MNQIYQSGSRSQKRRVVGFPLKPSHEKRSLTFLLRLHSVFTKMKRLNNYVSDLWAP